MKKRSKPSISPFSDPETMAEVGRRATYIAFHGTPEQKAGMFRPNLPDEPNPIDENAITRAIRASVSLAKHGTPEQRAGMFKPTPAPPPAVKKNSA